jgi:hypothetical protein
VQRVHPDHSPQRVHVDEHGVGAEKLLQGEVDEPDLRAAEQDPGHGEQNPWNHQRDEGQRKEQRLERRVGALVHPGEQRSQQERKHCGAARELDRAPEQHPRFRRAVGLLIVAERELRRLGGGLRREEALPQQESERHDAEVNRHRNAKADDQPFRIEGEPRRERRRRRSEGGGGQR